MMPKPDYSPKNRAIKDECIPLRTLGGKFRAWISDRSPVVLFGLKFGLCMALYYGVVLIPFCDRLLYGYLCASARVGGVLLNLLGYSVHVLETSIKSADFGISIRRGCDAIEPLWFFSAGVMSAPIHFRWKWPGLLAGAVVILSLNFIRIVSLFLIGRNAPGFFDTAHLEVWPVIFIVLGIALWAAWISWAKRRPERESHAAA